MSDYPKTRYFDENKKALKNTIKEGAFEMVCADGWEFNQSINNIEWDGDIPSFIESREEQETKQAEIELRSQYKSERDSALFNAEVNVGGMIFQTRPSDFINLTVGIDEESTEWILKDDSIVPVTTEQLELVLSYGKSQAKLIFDAYMDKVKSI